MAETNPADELASLIAQEEGRPAPAAETPPETPEAPPAETPPAAEAPPAAAETPPAEAAPADLGDLPEPVRARLADLERKAEEAERRAKAEYGRAQQATGKLRQLQTEQQNRSRGLAQPQAGGVPSTSPAPATVAPSATGGASTLPPSGATVDQAAAAALFETPEMQRLLRDYPEFAPLKSGFSALATELQSLRQSARASDDPGAHRIESLERQLREFTEREERTRFASFEREHQPQDHVHVKIVNRVDESGQPYREHVIQPRSPEFAWFYYSIPQDTRDAINWDDPDDLSQFFSDMKAAAAERGLITAPTSAAAPTAPAAIAAPAPPANRPRIAVAAVPRAPNAGVPRPASSLPMSPQQELAAMIAEEDGQVRA